MFKSQTACRWTSSSKSQHIFCQLLHEHDGFVALTRVRKRQGLRGLASRRAFATSLRYPLEGLSKAAGQAASSAGKCSLQQASSKQHEQRGGHGRGCRNPSGTPTSCAKTGSTVCWAMAGHGESPNCPTFSHFPLGAVAIELELVTDVHCAHGRWPHACRKWFESWQLEVAGLLMWKGLDARVLRTHTQPSA